MINKEKRKSKCKRERENAGGNERKEKKKVDGLMVFFYVLFKSKRTK